MRLKYSMLIFILLIKLSFLAYLFSPFGHVTRQAHRDIGDKHENSKENYEESSKYRINTKGCNITNLPVFDEETLKIFKNTSDLIWKCSKNRISVQRFNETWLKLDYRGLDPECYYRDLKRGNYDFNFIYGQFQGIEKNTIDLGEIEFVHIACYDKTVNESLIFNGTFNAKSTQLLHHQIIPMIPQKTKLSNSNVPNILLLAIDSTSYLNFKRHFIRTEKLIKKHNFIELKGYNKVGANTFPNMIPMLTGYHINDLVSDDKLGKIQFDDWPIIWKNFSNEGFVTIFVEEMPKYGLFHYDLKGFKNQPVDYQTRPFHREIEKYEYNRFCYSDRTEMQHSLDYTHDMLKALRKRNQKYFAYISICELSHGGPNGHHYMDVPYYNFIKNIFDDNLVNDTIIFFFSDHGLRFGKLRETHSGEMENRMPFSFTYFPSGTKEEYIDNFKKNQDRLTTHFDIHATMTHLINGKANPNLKYGISLIDQVVPDNRTCKDAGIPEMYCACHEDVAVDETDLANITLTVPKMLNKLNKLSESERYVCQEYIFDSFKSIYNRTLSTEDKEYLLVDSHIYIVQFYVKPGNALFETVLRSYEHDARFEIIGDLTRINKYGNQSHCINIKLMKNYCFCKDLIKY